MPTTTTRADAWPPERLDRLAMALLPLVFPGRQRSRTRDGQPRPGVEPCG
jgi:hypothetical protein